MRTIFLATVSVISLQGQSFAADAMIPSPEPPLGSSFAGFYTAIGGSYGIASHREFSIQSIYPSGLFGGGSISSNGEATPAGPSGNTAFGYNLTLGGLLLGIEVAGRWGDEAGRSSVPGSTGFPVLGGQSIHSYEFKNDIAGHLAGRIGGVFNDVLIYAKAGIGLTHVSETFSVNDAGATICTSNNLPCTVSRQGGIGAAVSDNWFPSFLAGIGAERNFGRLFGRIGAEFELWDAQSSGTISAGGAVPSINGRAFADSIVWTSRITGQIGFRF